MVADNASTDDSVAYVRREHPGVEVIELPENYGFAGGYNEALRRVSAEVYVLLNSDVRVTPGWLAACYLTFGTGWSERCSLRCWPSTSRVVLSTRGLRAGIWTFSATPSAGVGCSDIRSVMRGSTTGWRRYFWATGAALFIRSSVFHALGGFEPEYFAHAEEIDLCWRMKRAGYKVLVEPAATVFHVGGRYPGLRHAPQGLPKLS